MPDSNPADTPPPPHPPQRPLDHESFRALGRLMVDFIADYWRDIESRPVLPSTKPGDVRAALPPHAPLNPDVGDYSPVLADLERIILPALTHWQHPGFHAFFPANISTPAVLGEILAAGLGVQGMLWQTSPACTELETHVMDWMADLLGLPESFTSRSPRGGGVIHGTASEATLVAMVAARHRVRSMHPAGPPPHFTLYASDQAHSSLVKAAMIAGLADNPEDRRHVRLVPTAPDLTMDIQALEKMVREDLDAGRSPTMVHATVGTTGSTAFDRLGMIADVLDRTGASARGSWLHADAAHAGSAMICPEFRHLQSGVERADSYCFNPHKWLLTNFDCDCFFTRDRKALTSSLSVTPEYLRNPGSETGAVIDYRDWQVPLGRRFRALKLWLVLRHFGVSGLREYIRGHVRMAEWFESHVRADRRFELSAPRLMNLVCFRLVPKPGQDADELNRALLTRLNASGRVYLTHTVLPARGPTPARYVLRFCVGTTTTTAEHVRAAWELIDREAAALLG
jgi:aromatic-L-amino-acid/L-tryptophan decarboxylase